MRRIYKRIQKLGFCLNFYFISLFFASLIAKVIIKRKKTIILMRTIHNNCGIPQASAEELALSEKQSKNDEELNILLWCVTTAQGDMFSKIH